MTESTRRWLVLFGVGISGMLVAVDFTIVNTVLKAIQVTFDASMNTLQWVMTGFGITFSSILISAGRLADLIGRRKILYIGMIGFGLASLGAGLSNTILMLILCRVLQGVFGAVIFPSGMAITSNAFPPSEQGKAIGIYSSVLGIGLAIGPVLGGFITSIANWHWIFLINVPLLLLSLGICISVVTESRIEGDIDIDWTAMLLLVIGLACFVFAVTQSEVYGWMNIIILLPFILSLVLFFCVALIERKATMPLLPPALFFNNKFVIGMTIYSICVGMVWTSLFFIPLYLQNIFNMTEMETGVWLLPMTIMTVIAPIISGAMFDKQGPFLSTVIAFTLSILGYILFLFFSINFVAWLVLISFICAGFAWGIGNGISIPIALSSAQTQENPGLISGAAITILNVFGVVILSISSAIYHHVHNVTMHRTHHLTLAFLNGFHAVNIFLLAVTVLAFIFILFMFNREQTERTTTTSR